MVQTQEPVKQDHSVIRQLLSAGARVPPIAVIKALPKTTDNCSSKTENLKNTNLAEAFNFNKDITIEIIQVDDKSNGDDFNDIDLSSSSELFPEIGLPLPDLHDIDDMVTNETIQSPDYCKSVVNSVQIPTTPECVDSVMSCSFPKSNEALFSLLGSRDSVTSPCIVTPPGNQEFESQKMSPMQICSSSDSEAASSPPPTQSQSAASTPTETTASTIKSLLSRPPMKTSIPSTFTFTTNTSSASATSSSGTTSISPPVQMIPTTVVQAAPVIPLSVLAMGDDETAVEAQRQLKEIDEQQDVSPSPDVSSDEEEEMQEEPVIPVRRRWIKKASSASGPKQKRERKASSVSSEQDIDMDDLDSEVNNFNILLFDTQ